jgi:hypothetical protein
MFRVLTSHVPAPTGVASPVYFRRWYGPTLKAFEALDDRGRASLATDLVDLAQRCDRYRDGGSIALPATYLETVLTLR